MQIEPMSDALQTDLTEDAKNLIEILRLEGVNALGFGILPKAVMLDTALSCEAKAIYAYLCSYAGAGETAFPGRDKIMHDLDLGKRAYYAGYNLLLQEGYLTVQKRNNVNGKKGYASNIYTLVSNPKKYEEEPVEASNSKVYSLIRYSGLKATGYGIVPKAVMVDKRPKMTAKSKAIYCYFVVFTGAGDSAFPELDKLLYHLQISENTYRAHFKPLKDYNYITTKQRRVDGAFSVNDYYLNDKPDEDEIAPAPKNEDTEGNIPPSTKNEDMETKAVPTPRNEDMEGIMPAPKNAYMENGNAENADTENGDIENANVENAPIENADNNSNSIIKNSNISTSDTKNSSNKNNTISNRIPSIYLSGKEEKDGEMDRTEHAYNEIVKNGKLSYELIADPVLRTATVHLLTNWETFSDKEMWRRRTSIDADLAYESFLLFNEALIEMLAPSESLMKLKGAMVSYSQIFTLLERYVKIEQASMFSLSKREYVVNIDELRSEACGDFIKAISEKEIKSALTYMKSCIYSCLQTGSLKASAAIKRDITDVS